MIPSTLRDQDRSFCCQVNGNIILSKVFWWYEAVEATEVIEAAEVSDGREIIQ